MREYFAAQNIKRQKCDLSGEIDELSLRAAIRGGKIRRERFPPDSKVRQMKVHPSLKPGIWGAVIGAAPISVIGFSSFGWTLGSPADRMAKARAQTAVVWEL